MNLKSLSDRDLIKSTKDSVAIETKATTNVVRHFCEVFKRDLYLARGYSSMFLFARKECGYDKASAQRRVNAMELSLKVPEVLEKIDQGEMCLQSAADIQTFLNLERGQRKAYSVDEARELVKTCSGLSTRKVQIELAHRNPKIDFSSSKTFVSKDRLRVTHTISIATDEKLERIKNLRSHVNPYMSWDELLDFMAETTLDRIDPKRRDERIEMRRARNATAIPPEAPAPELQVTIPLHDEIVSELGEVQLAVDFNHLSRCDKSESELKPTRPINSKRHIKANDQRTVRREHDGEGCEFVDSTTGRRCGSHHQEQLDHIQEFSRGGSSRPENLRVYCAKHNRFRWRKRPGSYVSAERQAYG